MPPAVPYASPAHEMGHLSNEGTRLVDDYRRALEGALLAMKDPSGVAPPFDRRYTAWAREVDQASAEVPASWRNSVKRSVRDQMDRLLSRATYAHRERGKVDGKLALSYNKAVSQGLSKAPGQARSALVKEVEKTIHGMVVNNLRGADGQRLPASTEQQVTKALTQLAVSAPFTEKALLGVQDLVADMGLWLERRVLIYGEIEDTRSVVAKGGETTPAEAGAGDQKVGALAKQTQVLDNQIERQLAAKARKISTNVRFDPKLALDPQVKYLKSLEARAGVQIQQNGVVVDLRGRIKVTDPLVDSRKLDASADASVRIQNGTSVDRFAVGLRSTDIGGMGQSTSLTGSYTHSVGNNFSTGVSAGRTWQGGTVQDQVRVTLSWRF